MKKYYIVLLLFMIGNQFLYTQTTKDNHALNPSKYYWLEDQYGEQALNWVKDQYTKANQFKEQLELLDTVIAWKKKFISNRKPTRYSFVPQNADQMGSSASILNRSTWTRMKLDKYLGAPTFPDEFYDIRLIIPKGQQFKFDKVVCRKPDYTDCLFYYSLLGNRNIRIIREFNTESKKFIENGFELPPGVSEVFWRNENSVYLRTNLEMPLDTIKYKNNWKAALETREMSREYDYKLRIWNRYEPWRDSEVIYSSGSFKVPLSLFERNKFLFLQKQNSLYDIEYFLLREDELIALELPGDLQDFTIVSGQLVVHLRQQWKDDQNTFKAGSIIYTDFEQFLKGTSDFKQLMESTKELVADDIWNTDNLLIVRTLKDVHAQLIELIFNGNEWTEHYIEYPKGGNLTVKNTLDTVDRYYFSKSDFFSYESFTREPGGKIQMVYSEHEPVDSNDYVVKQLFANSDDGTKVPYFIVHRKGLIYNTNNPVIMHGYGGWSRSILPFRLGIFFHWLDNGGVYVLANIRGGGEYGPDWHFAAIREKRQKSFDDFQSIAEDLLERNVSKPKMIGAYGGSNGGILVSMSFIQRPDLFGAIAMNAPTLDLQRCSSPNGSFASVAGERGDASITEDWAFLKTYSPLHNLAAGQNYPPVLLMKNRGDDVSSPCHSRKFVYRMEELGYDHVYYFEEEDGGHSGSSTPNSEEIRLAFFYKHLHPRYEDIVSQTKR